MMMAQGGALDYGCYIQDTTGKLWKAGTWDGSATFNGVAVYTEECAFVMRQGANNKSMMSRSSTVSSSLIEYPTEQDAKTDFNGFGNTGLLPSSSSAKTYVEDNPFPDGYVGHIPSLGELWKAFEYKDEVNALFVEATGGPFTDALYGSSTLESGAGLKGSAAYFWTLDFSTGAVTSERATSTSTYIRPFGVLVIEGGSGTVKKINKITIASETLESPIVGSYTVLYAVSQYPVASDIEVTVGTSIKTFTVTISEGEKYSESKSGSGVSITSVTPAEDDTYIYTF